MVIFNISAFSDRKENYLHVVRVLLDIVSTIFTCVCKSLLIKLFTNLLLMIFFVFFLF